MELKMSTNIYHKEDGDLAELKGGTIAIIGYGNQGRAQAMNMRDSGIENIIIGNIKDTSWGQARKDGFKVYTIGEASKRANILFMLVPDEIAPEIYREEIEPGLKKGDALNFASGYNITYGFITPAKTVDVIMVAPRMIGKYVRSLYKEGKGFPSFFAVEQNYSGKAKNIALAISRAIGSARTIETTFEQETTSDLLSEQGFMPVVMAAIKTEYEIEVKNGIPPEVALAEIYLSKEIAEIFIEMAERGIIEQMSLHSKTSQYGQLTCLDKFNATPIREFMKNALSDIKSGRFAREWRLEQAMNSPVFKRLMKKYKNDDFIKAEQETMKKLGLRR